MRIISFILSTFIFQLGYIIFMTIYFGVEKFGKLENNYYFNASVDYDNVKSKNDLYELSNNMSAYYTLMKEIIKLENKFNIIYNQRHIANNIISAVSCFAPIVYSYFFLKDLISDGGFHILIMVGAPVVSLLLTEVLAEFVFDKFGGSKYSTVSLSEYDEHFKECNNQERYRNCITEDSEKTMLEWNKKIMYYQDAIKCYTYKEKSVGNVLFCSVIACVVGFFVAVIISAIILRLFG